MSYIFKQVYTKPNAETNINFWDGTNIVNLIDTFFDAGKITQKHTKSVEGLTETWTTIFKDYDSYIELAHGAMNQENIGTREKYCSDNNILFEDRSYED